MNEQEMISGQVEIQEIEGVEFPSISPLTAEEEQEMVDSFIEDRYPSDWRDDNPLPEGYGEGVEIGTAVLPSGAIYARASDAYGNGDGTGQYYLIREA